MTKTAQKAMPFVDQDGRKLVPILPSLIVNRKDRDFEIFLKIHGNRSVSYTDRATLFSQAHLTRLQTKYVYISEKDSHKFDQFVEKNFNDLLQTESIPSEERAEIFKDAYERRLQEAFQSKLPEQELEEFKKLKNMVKASVDFIRDNQNIRPLAKMIGHRHDVYRHGLAVNVLAIALASKLFDDKELIIKIGMGALFHDIGKNHIRKSILNKPGGLSDDERKEIETHPAKGHAECIELPLSEEARNIILYHHEKFAGGGYPSGKPAKKIPKYVRIVTIVDVYDALTSDRPYSSAMKPGEALRFMSGPKMEGLFDPELLMLFIKVLAGSLV